MSEEKPLTPFTWEELKTIEIGAILEQFRQQFEKDHNELIRVYYQQYSMINALREGLIQIEQRLDQQEK